MQRKAVEALKGISFSIHGGEICCLLGLNGAGKTSLVKILATLVTPDSGKVEICGIDLKEHPEKIRPLIGHVNTNERSFYWRLSVEENLNFFASLYGLTSRLRKKRVFEILELTEMQDKRLDRYDTCSAGQKQRLAIGRAMLIEPSVLLLDEPTSSLDVVTAQKLREFIKTSLIKNSDRAVLWCTHNLQEAELVSNRIVVLRKGQLIAEYSKSQIQDIARNQGIVKLIIKHFQGDFEDVLQPYASKIINKNVQADRCCLDIQLAEEEVPLLLNRIIAKGVTVYSCSFEYPNLEDLFTKLTREAE